MLVTLADWDQCLSQIPIIFPCIIKFFVVIVQKLLPSSNKPPQKLTFFKGTDDALYSLIVWGRK